MVILAIIAIPLVFVACGTRVNETIKIGIGVAQTGDLAVYGLSPIRAAELVVKEWNAKGGIDGKQIELFVEDDVCDPKVSPDVATKLIGDGVVAVMGHTCSGATEAALGIYGESNIPVISPSATNPPLTKSGSYPNFFRTIAPDDDQAFVQVTFVKRLGLGKVAILHDKQSYGKGLAEYVQSYIEGESGIEVVLFEGIQVDALDYSAILNKVNNSGADAVLFGGYHPEATKLVTQINEKGIDIVFIASESIKANVFLEIAGENAEGVYASAPNDASNEPIAIAAREVHVADYGEEPGAFFDNGSAAITVLLEAIEAAGSTEYDAIATALRSRSFNTALGTISFNEQGDAVGVGFSMYQVKDGQFVGVE